MSKLSPKLTETVNQNDTSPRESEKPHKKRPKTWGEHLFNWTTYGGFALIGNEITATAIVQQKDKTNWIGDAYRKGEAFFAGVGKPGAWKYIQGRMNYISFAIIGGMLMVPFIKLLEDSKSKLVRAADTIFYGAKAETSPELVAAHEEMDRAPQQSWGSLLKGRFLTVATAYTLDATVGWKGGMLARKLKDGPLEKFSSFDHLGKYVADALSHVFNVKTEATRGWMHRGAELLTLSTALTILFYGSSKFFAARREVAEHRKEKIHELEAEGVIPPKRALFDAADRSVHRDTPVTTIGERAHEPVPLQSLDSGRAPA